MHIKAPPSRLCYVKYTAFYLHSDKQSLSTHNWQEGGNDITIVIVSHTSCEWIHCFLDSEAIVLQFYVFHIKRLHVSFENL